ncbi:MAG: pentapeptide repeat-containing protein [Croceivirga sp.]
MRAFFADQTHVKKDFQKIHLQKGDYENCTFEGCQFQEGLLDNQNFVECRFIDCDLTNANISHTQFNSVVFEGCKLVGIQFDTCAPLLLRLSFKECNLSLSRFYDMQLPSTHFTDCKLHQVDFGYTNLSKSIFTNCDFKDALFENTNLSAADFSTAFNFNIEPTQNNIKKALFSAYGLMGLLKKHDIVMV